MKILFGIAAASFLVGGMLLAFAAHRTSRRERHERWVKYFVYFAIVMTVLGAARLGQPWLPGLLSVILVLATMEIFSALKRVPGRGFALKVWLAFGSLSIVYLLSLFSTPATLVAFVYVVVATFDGFSQATGQLVGRHKLAERVSPGKTIEGTVGGMAAAICMAVLARSAVGLSVAHSLAYGVLIGASGLCGDLAASWLKRRTGVKDFGRLLPGHGGVLDRFDSFIVAFAVCGLWLMLDGN
jgi:phosphatidate cytidylyltransferase